MCFKGRGTVVSGPQSLVAHMQLFQLHWNLPLRSFLFGQRVAVGGLGRRQSVNASVVFFLLLAYLVYVNCFYCNTLHFFPSILVLFMAGVVRRPLHFFAPIRLMTLWLPATGTLIANVQTVVASSDAAASVAFHFH